MPEKSVWDEWRETKAQIKTLQNEIDKLAAKERELNAQIFHSLDRKNGNVLLTARQQEVLNALCGPPVRSNKEISEKLNLSGRTVKFHISALLGKYRVRSRMELVLEALKSHEGKNT
jgi:DNA-binding NarL/FixJ family response regulator